jgi:hypothetical protein
MNPQSNSIPARAIEGSCNTIREVTPEGGFKILKHPAWKRGSNIKLQTCILREEANGASIKTLQIRPDACHGRGLDEDGGMVQRLKQHFKRPKGRSRLMTMGNGFQ